MHVASHCCFNIVAERRLPTRGEKEERGVVVQAKVEANATNSDGHDIPVFDMSSGDAEDDEREYFSKRNDETAKNKSFTSKVCDAEPVKVEVQGVLDDILRRIIGVEAILRAFTRKRKVEEEEKRCRSKVRHSGRKYAGDDGEDGFSSFLLLDKECWG